MYTNLSMSLPCNQSIHHAHINYALGYKATLLHQRSSASASPTMYLACPSQTSVSKSVSSTISYCKVRATYVHSALDFTLTSYTSYHHYHFTAYIENFIYKNHRGKPFLKHNYVTAHTPSAVAAADTSDATIAALASPAIDARQYKDEDSYDDTAVKSLTAIKAVSKKIDAAAVAATAATVPTVAVAATTVTVAVAGVKKRKYGIIQQPILLDRVKKSTSSKSNAMSTSEKKYTSSSSKQTKASHNSYQKKASHM